MKIIKPACTHIEQGYSKEDLYKHIEFCGRTCYKSENLITENSSEAFVDNLIKNNHLAMLEHATVYLWIPVLNTFRGWYGTNKYSTVTNGLDDYDRNHFAVTTNLRVIIENGWEDDLKYLCAPTKFHLLRHTFKCTVDIHVYKDITRHREASYAIESTRYCNYLKGKFGASVTFLEPSWLKPEDRSEFEEDLKLLEGMYFKWLNKGYQAQHAAYFLVQGTKADMVITADESEFRHILDLRYKGVTGAPHPDVKVCAGLLLEELNKLEFKY